MKKTKEPDVLTAAGLMAWIEKRVGKRELKKTGHESTLAAACWFIANQEVDIFRDMSTRDLCELLTQPNSLPQYVTVEDVEQWLVDIRDDSLEKEEAREQLIKDLHDFWGVPR
jgi:hypothetical protein